MKVKGVGLFLVVLLTGWIDQGYSENPKSTEIESTIQRVTVFTDRAEITRVAKAELTAGVQDLVFSDLPARLDQGSLQAQGSGNASILDLHYQRIQVKETASEARLELEGKLEEVNDSLHVLKLAVERLKKQQTFLKSMQDRIASPPGEGSQPDLLNPEKWEGMVSFYAAQLAKLDEERVALEHQKRDFDKKKDLLKRQLNELNAGKEKWRHQVVITLDVAEAALTELALTYQVRGPSWAPLYEARSSSEDKNVGFTYFATIKQQTGEDWTDVELTLSTAQPSIHARQPDLSPWRLSVVKLGEDGFEGGFGAGFGGMVLDESESDQLFNMHIAKSRRGPKGKMAQELSYNEAQITQKGFAATQMKVPNPMTVQSDNKTHRSFVLKHDFPATFRFSAVPKQSDQTYLKAEVKNATGVPLLPGYVNVFHDEGFVGKSYLDLVNPNEEFWTFLGTAPRMKVERKFIRRFREDTGIRSKKERITFEYEFEIENTLPTKEELVVWDQRPITTDEDIKIIPVNPPKKADESEVKVNESNYVEWFFELEPGEKKTFPFVFSVEYPGDEIIDGL